MFGGAMLESIILRKYLKVSISPKVLNINQNKKFSNVDFANFHDIQTTDTAVLCKIRNSAKKIRRQLFCENFICAIFNL